VGRQVRHQGHPRPRGRAPCGAMRRRRHRGLEPRRPPARRALSAPSASCPPSSAP
jgi:hypothetical protein